MGRLLDALEQTPDPRDPSKKLIDTTVVVLYSDHGWHLGEKKHWNKQSVWEEATRIPFVWHVPGITKNGAVSRVPVCLLDVYPTLNSLCRLPPVKDLDGVDLSALLANPSETLKRQAVVSTYFLNTQAVRSENWRLIWYGDGTMELYDHRTDPGEHTNLVFDAAGREKYKTVGEEHLAVLRHYQPTEVDRTRMSPPFLKWLCEREWGTEAPPEWLR